MGRWADHPTVAWALGLLALVFAAIGAEPYATSWNDGSRFASVESLVERDTFCIDDSIFLKPTPELSARGTPPYDLDNPLLRQGTWDRLFINGHWYSDKPPLVSVPLAGIYRVAMAFGVPRPSERPDIFARVMCVLLSGLPYAIAVGCMWTLGKRAGLPHVWRFAWLAAFAFASVLPTYTRSANSHIAQLGAVAAICVLVCRIGDYAARGRYAWGSLVAAGFLTGFAYNLDYGVGPPLVPAILAVVALRTRRILPVLVCGLAMLPCIVTGHAINYAIGNDWLRPLNMHREYLDWPGSPFDTTMTGVLRGNFFPQLSYVFDLLFGKKGIFTHNLPLFLALFTGVSVLKRPGRDRLELLALCAWCAIGWLMYGVFSKNHGGWCISIRWFVPFVVPGFWLLAKVLVDRPEFRRDFVLLSVWGAFLSGSAWIVGPWWPRNVPLCWWVFGGAIVTWGLLRYFAARAKREAVMLQLPAPGREVGSKAA